MRAPADAQVITEGRFCRREKKSAPLHPPIRLSSCCQRAQLLLTGTSPAFSCSWSPLCPKQQVQGIDVLGSPPLAPAGELPLTHSIPSGPGPLLLVSECTNTDWEPGNRRPSMGHIELHTVCACKASSYGFCQKPHPFAVSGACWVWC